MSPKMKLTHCVSKATEIDFSFISFLYPYKAYIHRCPGYCFLWSLSLKQIDYLIIFAKYCAYYLYYKDFFPTTMY